MSTLTNNIQTENEERIARIDFKMVTFSLAGKEYGIDIMKVKEIAKDNEFTFVPNTASYVRGVYNLRGDIISVIDLRLMFNLSAEERKNDEPESMIILRLEESVIGVIVDYTDKVVGIDSETIQPPHPLFGDINVKYISGVVEHDERLYIILDVERIFGQQESEETVFDTAPVWSQDEPEAEIQEAPVVSAPLKDEPLDLAFISETLITFKKFHVSPLNSDWVGSRYKEWEQMRKSAGKEVQLTSQEDAEEFLLPFYSPSTGRIFPDEIAQDLFELLPDKEGATISAWNPGCGKGYESYSLACLLKEKYPGSTVKIWAHDNDLLAISTAQALPLDKSTVPSRWHRFIEEGDNGAKFLPEIKNSILFEYHDIAHQNTFPPVDIVFARDTFSFLTKEDQMRIMTTMEEKIKPDGIVVLGKNETMTAPGWTAATGKNIIAYKRESI